MKQIVLLLLLSLGGFAFADKIYQIDACAAKLEVPNDWKLEGVDGSDSAVPFLDQRAGGSQRRIHFNIPKVQAKTLDSAMNGELDRIGERSPGSLATREFLHDARKLKTRSGIDGLMARFSTKNSEGLYFWINKFYFKDSNGKISVVCIHTYGDQSLSDKFEAIVLDGLSLAD